MYKDRAKRSQVKAKREVLRSSLFTSGNYFFKNFHYVHLFRDYVVFFLLRYPEHLKAAALRKKQAAKMAYNHVAQGIKHFKNNESIEAFQCLNQVCFL
jgi:hypothetical protein